MDSKNLNLGREQIGVYIYECNVIWKKERENFLQISICISLMRSDTDIVTTENRRH